MCVLFLLFFFLETDRVAGVPRDLGPLFIVHGSLGRLIDRMAGEVNPMAVRVLAMARFLKRNAIGDLRKVGGGVGFNWSTSGAIGVVGCCWWWWWW